MVSARVVWAVGWGQGWPREIYVLFGTQREADRHAASSAYVFDVFPLAVYGSYDDCPTALKLKDSSSAGLETAADDAYKRASLAADSQEPPHDEDLAAPVYAVGAWEAQGEPEVWALYEHAKDAEHHVAAAYYMLETRTLPVFARYDDCPAGSRYIERGPPLSQLVLPRSGN